MTKPWLRITRSRILSTHSRLNITAGTRGEHFYSRGARTTEVSIEEMSPLDAECASHKCKCACNDNDGPTTDRAFSEKGQRKCDREIL